MPRYTITTQTNISLTANTPKTVAAVSTAASPSARRARLVGFSVSFDSVTGTDNSVLCEIVRSDATTAGTATSRTPVPIDAAETAALCSGFVNYTAGNEPTVLTVINEKRITPVGGTLIEPFEFLDQPVAPATNRLLGVRLTSAQAQSNVRCTLTFEE
jgi:hypothetical protein